MWLNDPHNEKASIRPDVCLVIALSVSVAIV